MNAEHKRPLFAFLIVTVIAAVVFANGLQRQVLNVIRDGASNVIAGTSLLHDPLYVVEEGARIAAQDETSSAAGDPAGQTGTPPVITEDDPAAEASPIIAPGPQEPAATGPTRSGGGATPGGNATAGGDATQGGNATAGGTVAGGGQGRPRDGDGATGNDGPGGGGPVTTQPDQAEGNGEPPERPEARGHGRSDDRSVRRADHSGPGKSGADRDRGHERASGHGSGHERGQHKAQGKGHGGGHDGRGHGGKGKGHAGQGHGRH